MAPLTNSQTLRAIGQALQARRLQDFDLERKGSSFLVRATRGNLGHGSGPLIYLLRKLYRSSNDCFELRYGPEDVERLEQEGQSRRRDPDKTPDFYIPSQILRTVGAYVDRRGARLLSVSRRGATLTVTFRDSGGHRNVEEHFLPSFYSSFVRMYLHRGARLST